MIQQKQINKNLLFNIVNLTINVIIALFYIPYLVKTLGMIAYGIIPLALIVNQYIGVITGSLTNSLTRFYSISVEQKEFDKASSYLSSSFVVITIIAVILLPIFGLFVLNVDSILNIPIEYVDHAKLLFSFTLFGFILSLYSSLINITLYAENRLDVLNLLAILRLGVKVILTLLFFENISIEVSYIGYSNFLSELLVLIVSLLYYKKTINNKVNISVSFYDKASTFGILSMAVWVVVHQLGDTALYRTDNVLVNKFWSTRESGILGALSELGNYVLLTVGVISSLFGPLILKAYSIGDHNQVKKLAVKYSLLVGILSSILVGVLIGFSKPLIGIWLGEEYKLYSDWFVLKLIVIPFYAASGVFAFVYKSWNKIRIPAIITVVIGLMNFLICTYILNIGANSEEYISYMLVASVFFILLQSYGLNAFWFANLYPEVKINILRVGFLILLALLITCIFSYIYNKIFKIQNAAQFAIGTIAVVCSVIPILFKAFWKITERKIILEYIKENIKNVFSRPF